MQAMRTIIRSFNSQALYYLLAFFHVKARKAAVNLNLSIVCKEILFTGNYIPLKGILLYCFKSVNIFK